MPLPSLPAWAGPAQHLGTSLPTLATKHGHSCLILSRLVLPHSEKGPSPELGSWGWDLGVFPAGSPMPGAGAFTCPSCRMAFSSQPLLRAHQERLCLGTPMDGGSRGDPSRARRLQDPSVL